MITKPTRITKTSCTLIDHKFKSKMDEMNNTLLNITNKNTDNVNDK